MVESQLEESWNIPFGAIHNAFDTSWENGLKRLSHLGFLFDKQVEMVTCVRDQPAWYEEQATSDEYVEQKGIHNPMLWLWIVLKYQTLALGAFILWERSNNKDKNWACPLLTPPQFVHVWNPQMGRAREEKGELEQPKHKMTFCWSSKLWQNKTAFLHVCLSTCSCKNYSLWYSK